MFEALMLMFQYDFMVQALVVGILISLCAALLGVSLVLKRYSLIGDGLSHVGFAALTIAMAMNLQPLAVAIPVVVLAAFLLLRLSESGKIKGDSAIALLSTTALALGVIVADRSKGLNVDVKSYLFGSILAMSRSDVWVSVILSGCVLILFALFYNRLFAVTFDEGFAKATGTKSELLNVLIALLTAVTIVVGMRMMGTLLISSLVIFPALTAMRVMKSFRQVVLTAALLSAFCMALGLFCSMALSIPAGASVVAVNATLFAVFSAIRWARKA